MTAAKKNAAPAARRPDGGPLDFVGLVDKKLVNAVAELQVAIARNDDAPIESKELEPIAGILRDALADLRHARTLLAEEQAAAE